MRRFMVVLLAVLIAFNVAPRTAFSTTQNDLDQFPPAYYEARQTMVNGILITAIGSAVGGSAMGAAWMFGTKELFLGGVMILSCSLLVGIPMIGEGSREKRRIRRDIMEQKAAAESTFDYGITIGRNGLPALSLQYQF